MRVRPARPERLLEVVGRTRRLFDRPCNAFRNLILDDEDLAAKALNVWQRFQ